MNAKASVNPEQELGNAVDFTRTLTSTVPHEHLLESEDFIDSSEDQRETISPVKVTSSTSTPNSSTMQRPARQTANVPPTLHRFTEGSTTTTWNPTDDEINTLLNAYGDHIYKHLMYIKRVVHARKEYEKSISAMEKAKQRYISIVKAGKNNFYKALKH